MSFAIPYITITMINRFFLERVGLPMMRLQYYAKRKRNKNSLSKKGSITWRGAAFQVTCINKQAMNIGAPNHIVERSEVSQKVK